MVIGFIGAGLFSGQLFLFQLIDYHILTNMDNGEYIILFHKFLS